MSIFGKIKSILFEDDPEGEENIPVYTKDDLEDKKKQDEIKREEVTKEQQEEPIKTTEYSRFSNVKRDIDVHFDDELEEVPGASEVFTSRSEKNSGEVTNQVKEEKKSIFPSFDEDEFERLNSRIIKNENKIKREEKKVESVGSGIRKNTSSYTTTTVKDNKPVRNFSSTSISSSTNEKKPFTPSPVISPVYGILGENYKKDDIVDKQNGFKREKISKPVPDTIGQRTEEKKPIVKEEVKVEPKKETISIDSVRRKAYGSLESLEKKAALEVKKNTEKPALQDEIELPKEDVKVSKIKIEDIEEKEEKEKVKEVDLKEHINYVEPSIEDEIEDEKPLDVDSLLKEETNDEVENVDNFEEKEITKEEKVIDKKPQKLDELEKTSTLQILDDIEKELNSIKPITKEENDDTNDEDIKEKLERNDTLENDLFNLIDSMYEEGEEDDEDD